MDLTKATIERKGLKKALRKVSGNNVIADYYKNISERTGTGEARAEAVRNCLKVWDIDYYRLQKVKDVLRVNLCHDKFCPNCQNLISKARYAKYRPELDKLLNDYSIYHVVFTVPNCKGETLKTTLTKMYTKYVYVIQYLQGKRKCKGIDFLKYGFVGAVRSLEITTTAKTTRPDDLEYHPHFHCLFVLKKNIREEKKYLNDFSFTVKQKRHREADKRFFNDFEILLQKSWYLFFNDKKFTKKAFDELQQGYSVYAERVNGNYKEVFKYAVKGLYDPKTGSFNYPQEVFEILYDALHRRKIIQGYGLLNKFTFEDDLEVNEAEDIYNEIIQELKKIEDPLRFYARLNEIVSDFDENEDIIYISKKKSVKLIEEREK